MNKTDLVKKVAAENALSQKAVLRQVLRLLPLASLLRFSALVPSP